MRFLIDANLPRSAVALLVGFGHEVDFARDIGMAYAKDFRRKSRAPRRTYVNDFRRGQGAALCVESNVRLRHSSKDN